MKFIKTLSLVLALMLVAGFAFAQAKDTASFEKFKSENGSFAFDPAFETLNKKALTQNTMSKTSNKWYALALMEFKGAATVAVEDGVAHYTIQKPGPEVHSVQLVQHVDIAKGYKYTLSFEAKAAKARDIVVKISGDETKGWALYSEQYTPSLTTDYQKFSYTFVMNANSDSAARLDFNLGTNASDVWIKNVKLTAE